MDIIVIVCLVVFPVAILPLLMRFVVGRIVLGVVRKKYLPAYQQEMLSGWEDETDRKAMEAACTFALQRLKFHFRLQPAFMADIKVLFLVIKNSYNPGSDPAKEEYRFSIRRLIECFFLAFCDLYREYSGKQWFKAIAGLKLIWFYRLLNLNKYYKALFAFPTLPFLQSTRLLGRLLRLLLIPLFGIPVLIFDIMKSVIMSLAYEGYFRFLYGLILMKIAYYGLYLYGKKNSAVTRRIKSIPKKKLNEIFVKVETLLDPAQYTDTSALFGDAVKAYDDCLAEYGITHDPLFKDTKPTFAARAGKIIDRIRVSIYRAYKRKPRHKEQDGELGKKPGLLTQAYGLYSRISNCYVPKIREPVLQLRIHELIECGYMGSVLLLNKLLTTPLINTLLDKISADMVIKVKAFVELDFVKLGLGKLKGAYKYYRLIAAASRIWKVARGIASPFTLLLTAGAPVLFQQLKDSAFEYLFHRQGRLVIFAWERNASRKKAELKPLLW